jgi:4-carboxymuconolactone decarboxylase
MGKQCQELLQRLREGDESSARMVMALNPEPADSDARDLVLPPRIRMLVRLASLIAVGASTTSLRWAVELASCAGADADDIVGVLASVGSEVGVPCVVLIAPRLALAIGYDIDAPDFDES